VFGAAIIDQLEAEQLSDLRQKQIHADSNKSKHTEAGVERPQPLPIGAGVTGGYQSLQRVVEAVKTAIALGEAVIPEGDGAIAECKAAIVGGDGVIAGGNAVITEGVAGIAGGEVAIVEGDGVMG
jgi:hypothetical protein